jgi:hypothetical protein
MLRRFGDFVLLVCCDISESICAVMFRRFGGYLCSYVPTFLKLVMLRRFGGFLAVMLRRFGEYLCHASTFRRLSVLLVRCDISETICVLMLRRFGDCAVITRAFRYFSISRSENWLW